MNHTNINTRNPIQGILKERGVKRFDEERLIRNFIKAAGLDYSAMILDVGCGLGEKMQWLVEDGYTPHGIDINPYVVEKIRSKGFYCITPEDFSKVNYTYDLMIMSHIIEHFYPDDLLTFINKYLNRLKTGGHVVIATPLEWNNFYGDFDHIKIYHPQTFITLSR